VITEVAPEMAFGADHPTIPVLRPLLPDATAILPYLERIDASRIYSNFGPLAEEFQDRLARRLSIGPESALTISCGTTGLIAAILATANFENGRRRLALMPSFTFAATAVAAERCCLHPYFVDVDPISWALNPERLLDHPVLDRVAVVVAVAPFGRPLPQSDWLVFQERTGIPVVFDSAAAFAVVGLDAGRYIGPIPSVFSFQATKSFGVGEGGGIVCANSEIMRKMRTAINFGFDGARDSLMPSINGKMNEYSAAVGLAAHDLWETKLRAIDRISSLYRECFAKEELADRFLAWPEIDGSYALYRAAGRAERDALMRAFDKDGVEYRLWYGEGCHKQKHFSAAERDDLPVTEGVGANLLGIPMAPDLPEESIQRVVRIAASVSGKIRDRGPRRNPLEVS
jgi:dTDP-4-amino-4,6-dideoxygalactose transaminase